MLNYCLRPLLTVILVCSIAILGNAQNDSTKPATKSDSSLANLSQRQIDKYTNSIHKKASSLSNKLEKTNQKALTDLQKQEQKLRKKLSKVDSSLAKQLFDKPNQQLQQISNKVQQKASKLNKLQQLTGNNNSKEYLPLLDTFKTSLKFLDTKLTNNPLQEQTNKALGSIKGLESQLQNATDIKVYIKERKAELTKAFDQYGMGKQLQSLNKQAYYYGQQVNEYKQLLKDPKKLEERAITELIKSSLFKDFMKNNSQLASLFRVPDNYGTPQALAGLQTRASVNQLISQRLGTITAPTTGATAQGGNPQQYLQQQVQQAQGELNKLKDKINKAGGGSSDLEMPNFKPNNQKTKSFFDRLEYGLDIQTAKQNSFFPVTSDLGLTVGYKLNDKSVVGLGIAYKMGWGNGFKDINLTNEGIGLRSYMDMKLKGSLFISGGYEQNYQQRFGSIGDLYHLPQTSWRQSALFGLTKKISITKKKTTKVQVLYDFLYQQNHVQTQPLVFRVGWGM